MDGPPTHSSVTLWWGHVAPPGGNFTKSAVDDRRGRARPHNEEEDFKKEGCTAEARMRGRLWWVHGTGQRCHDLKLIHITVTTPQVSVDTGEWIFFQKHVTVATIRRQKPVLLYPFFILGCLLHAHAVMSILQHLKLKHLLSSLRPKYFRRHRLKPSCCCEADTEAEV
jgi:hypothetical protein